MLQSKAEEILKHYNKDQTGYKLEVVTVKKELRGKAQFTDHFFYPGYPVFKYFDRNPEQSYRFIPGDELVIVSTKGMQSGIPIYYVCELQEGVPTDDWYHFPAYRSLDASKYEVTLTLV